LSERVHPVQPPVLAAEDRRKEDAENNLALSATGAMGVGGSVPAPVVP